MPLARVRCPLPPPATCPCRWGLAGPQCQGRRANAGRVRAAQADERAALLWGNHLPSRYPTCSCRPRGGSEACAASTWKSCRPSSTCTPSRSKPRSPRSTRSSSALRSSPPTRCPRDLEDRPPSLPRSPLACLPGPLLPQPFPSPSPPPGGGPCLFFGSEQVLRLVFRPPACLPRAKGQKRGGGSLSTRAVFCRLSGAPAPSAGRPGGGVCNLRTSRRIKAGIQATLDTWTSTLVSEAKAGPLKYLIAFPCGLRLGERQQARGLAAWTSRRSAALLPPGSARKSLGTLPFLWGLKKSAHVDGKGLGPVL